MLTIYGSDQLGNYGWVEKPWYQPGERLSAILAEISRRELVVDRAEAPPATDADLALFHDAAYVAEISARCAANQGSLDRAPPHVNARSRRLVRAIADVGSSWVTAADLGDVLAELECTLAEFAPFLQSEGLVDYRSGDVRLTDAGRAFLSRPDATLGGPTYARAHVETAARHVCGAVLDAVRRIASGELKRVFVPIAGFHHAHPSEARMYCLYNDAALAVTAALDAIEGPIAYIDVDIHHGDGVYQAFAADPRVVIADLYEGEPGATAVGTIALGPGTTDDDYLAAWETLAARVRAVKPRFIVLEAGVDGLATDPMSNQALTPAVFGEITRRVRAMADEHADGRLLVLGGGGYELTGLAAGWGAVVEALVGGSSPPSPGSGDDDT